MIAITVFVALVGAIVGSFLNVVVLRLHAGKGFVKGRSACPHCHHELGPLELVPIVSWLVLRGRCRHCRGPISPQYILVEALTAALFVVAYLTHPVASLTGGIQLVLWLYVIASFVVLAVYDLRWYLLPDKVLLPVIVPALALGALSAVAAHQPRVIIGPIGAALLFGGAFYAVALVSRGRWMGGGDIKLAFVMGLLLGLRQTALAMMVGVDTAAIVGLTLIAARRKKRTDMIPFGPFLILGTLVSYFWGAAIIQWYVHLVGLGAT